MPCPCAGQTDLEQMTGYGEHAGKVSVLEQYAIDEKADVPMSFHVETVYTGDRADNFRAHVATRGMDRVTQENLDFYRKRYAGLVESKPLEVRD
jgi:hypothetical protein